MTKLVAQRLGLGLEGDIPDLVWTALGLMMALGLAGAALVILIAPWLVRGVLQIPGPLQGESLVSFYLLAAALPFVISTAGLRGVMEAYQRVGLINLVSACVRLFTLVGPLLVLPFAGGLGPVVAVLVVVRLASWAIHLRLCFGAVPGLRRGVAVRSDLIRPLLSFGGWLTLANIVNPIMVQMDRFFIGPWSRSPRWLTTRPPSSWSPRAGAFPGRCWGLSSRRSRPASCATAAGRH